MIERDGPMISASDSDLDRGEPDGGSVSVAGKIGGHDGEEDAGMGCSTQGG